MESLPTDIVCLLSDRVSIPDSVGMLCLSKTIFAILHPHHQKRVYRRKLEIFGPVINANTDPIWTSTIHRLIAEAHLTSQQWYTGLKTQDKEWIFVRGNAQYVTLLTLMRFPFVYLSSSTEAIATELLKSIAPRDTLYVKILEMHLYLEPVVGIKIYTE